MCDAHWTERSNTVAARSPQSKPDNPLLKRFQGTPQWEAPAQWTTPFHHPSAAANCVRRYCVGSRASTSGVPTVLCTRPAVTRWVAACCRLPSQAHLTARHIPFLPLETKPDRACVCVCILVALLCLACVCAAELGWIGLDRIERPSRQVRLPPDLCVPRLSFASRSLLSHLITPPSRDQTDRAARLHSLRVYSVSSPSLRATRHHLQGHQPNGHFPPSLPNNSRGQGATNHGLNRTLSTPASLRLTS